MSSGNGGSWHPEAVADLAQEAARKAESTRIRQADADSFINEIRDGLKANAAAFEEFREGNTAWQMRQDVRLADVADQNRAILKILRQQTHQIQTLMMARLVMPGLALVVAVGALAVLGGASLELLLHVAGIAR